MKLPKSMLCVLLTLVCAAGMAQTTTHRQNIYAAYPQTVSTDRTVINNTFDYTEGSTVTIPFATSFHFTGVVTSNRSAYSNLQMVTIRSTDNTIFQLSKITNNDNTISYTGRTFNDNAADGYEIKNNNGNYSLNKFVTARVLTPCSQ
jgi:hypothetical protein